MADLRIMLSELKVFKIQRQIMDSNVSCEVILRRKINSMYGEFKIMLLFKKINLYFINSNRPEGFSNFNK